ncbi:MAG: hypothetical protein EBV34_18215, partial [Betaproteobacteria bacterium]|nr:hypothetical protein [Betaproteobacteria bacterium]
GGTDVSSGKSFEGVLRAPPGSAVVNPLTTVVASLVDGGRSVAAAESLVASALGIDLTKLGGALSDFDPIAASLSTSGNRDAALQVASAAAQVISVAVSAGSAISGAAGGEGKLSTSQASGAVMTALAAKLEAAAGQSSTVAQIKLSDPAIVGDLITRSAAAVVSGLSSDAASAVSSQSAAVAQSASAVIAQTAASIEKIVSTPGVDPSKALAQVTQVQIAAQTSIADQLQSAVQGGRIDRIAVELSSAAITALVAAAEVKALDPNSASDAALIQQSGTGTKPPDPPAAGADTTVAAEGADTVGGGEPPITSVTPGTLSLANYNDTGISTSDRISSDNSFDLVLSGSQPGATVTYQRSANGGASWSSVGLSQNETVDGSFQYRALVAIGSISAISNVISVQVDRGVVTGVLGLGDYVDKGTAGDYISDDADYVLTVTGAETGAEFAFERAVGTAGSYVTLAVGQSSFAVVNATQASISYRVLVKDVAGNTAYGSALNVGYDPAAAYGVLNFGTDFTDSGSSSSDRLSNDGVFTLVHSGAGTSDAVVFERRFIPVGATDGSWVSVGASQSLSADGSYSFRALVTQAVNGATAYTPTVGYVLDTGVNPVGVLGFGTDFTDSGSSSTDRVSNDTAFSLQFTTLPEIGASWQLQRSTDGTSWSNLGVSVTEGGFPVNLAGLSGGAYSFRVLVADRAGNTAASSTVGYLLDTAPPSFAGATLGISGLTDSNNDRI